MEHAKQAFVASGIPKLHFVKSAEKDLGRYGALVQHLDFTTIRRVHKDLSQLEREVRQICFAY